jgi:hypothetical protein
VRQIFSPDFFPLYYVLLELVIIWTTWTPQRTRELETRGKISLTNRDRSVHTILMSRLNQVFLSSLLSKKQKRRCSLNVQLPCIDRTTVSYERVLVRWLRAYGPRYLPQSRYSTVQTVDLPSPYRKSVTIYVHSIFFFLGGVPEKLTTVGTNPSWQEPYLTGPTRRRSDPAVRPQPRGEPRSG